MVEVSEGGQDEDTGVGHPFDEQTDAHTPDGESVVERTGSVNRIDRPHIRCGGYGGRVTLFPDDVVIGPG